MDVRWLVRSALATLPLAAEAPLAAGQAGPPCGPDLPIKCTPGKDAAIVLGFVGAGVVAIYLDYRMDHPKNEATVVGCTTQAGGGMILVEDNTQTLYSLAPLPQKVKAGKRVGLRGKNTLDAAGRNVFRTRKFVTDERPCEMPGPGAEQELRQ